MNRASVALRDALGEWALTDISAAISAIRQIKSAEEAAFRGSRLPRRPCHPGGRPSQPRL
ncbi:MAG: hypothetical protein ACLSAH_06075 [Bilophila wadsworthia]